MSNDKVEATFHGHTAEPGEAYYIRWGWSGCAGSAWRTLPSGAKDGWRHAEEAQARADALAAKFDRCVVHLRTALGYSDDQRDAGLESLAVQVRVARVAHESLTQLDDYHQKGNE